MKFKKCIMILSLLMAGITPAKADELYICQNCPTGYWSNGYFKECVSCLSTGVSACDSTNGKPTACKAGYGFVSYNNCAANCSASCANQSIWTRPICINDCKSSCNMYLLNPTCTKCSAGKYSAGGTASCSKCSAGSYSSAGASSCSTCPAGSYSSAGASSCSTCPAGYYCPGGTDKKICPAGSYCPNTGMSAPKSCSNMGSRYYQSKEGQTTCSYCSDDSGVSCTYTSTCSDTCYRTVSDCSNCASLCDDNASTCSSRGCTCGTKQESYSCTKSCSKSGTKTKYYKVSSDRKSCYNSGESSCS